MFRLVLFLLLGLPAAHAETAPKYYTFDPAKVEKSPTATPSSSPPVSVAAVSTPTYDWIPYSKFWCDVDWIHYCVGPDLVITVPAGWQACSSIYTVSRNEGFVHQYKVTSEDWMITDPLEPPGFRTYRYSIEARGNGRFFDRQGANVTLTNIGIRLIKVTASYKERFDAKCELPPMPGT
jgi:hypothetical protein